MARLFSRNDDGHFNREDSYFAFTAENLEEGIAGRVYAYRRWDKGFGAWRVTRNGGKEQFFPNWPLVNKAGNSILCEDTIPVFDDVPAKLDSSGVRDIIHPYAGIYHLCSLGRDEYLEAYDAFVDLIPLSSRQTIGAIGWCQWLLFDAITIRENIQGFLEKLVEDDETAFIRACFILSRYWALNLKERGEILDYISNGHRGRILLGITHALPTRNNPEVHRELEDRLQLALLAAYGLGKESDVLEFVRSAPHLIDLEFRLGNWLLDLTKEK